MKFSLDLVGEFMSRRRSEIGKSGFEWYIALASGLVKLVASNPLLGLSASRGKESIKLGTESSMRNLMIIGMLVAAAFMAGWFKVNRDGENTTIEINRGEIRNDTENAITRGREYLDRYETGQGEGFNGDAQEAFNLQEKAQWAQEQVAAQREQWGRNYDNVQSYIPSEYQTQSAEAAQQIQNLQPQQFYPPQR
ncbi:MAG: hypothetical protein ACR2NZ_08810 [Rubripirellula sp.]